jgi:pimeloyl-ACP methyl ester carboxylesterase
VDQLGCGPVIVVGYSMGGLIAQLLWRRHPELVAGLVLCSTTRAFVPGRRERYLFGTTMNYAAGTVRLSRLATRWYPAGLRPLHGLRPGRTTSLRVWAAGEMRRHDMRQVLEAGHATCQFDSAPWIGDVDVPTAVVMTTQDRAIPLDAQCQLADSIGEATVHSIDDDHTACAHATFAPVLLAACRDVAARVDQLA